MIKILQLALCEILICHIYHGWNAASAQIPLPTQPLENSNTISPELAQIEIKQVKVVGNTVFSETELATVTAPFIGKKATFSELWEIAQKITDLYVSQGYITSGALLPPQKISETEGVVVIQIIEGKLEKIAIEGLNHLQKSYVSDRLWLAATPPVNIKRLEQALQLLQINPLFEQIRAELKQGSMPNLSVLEVNLTEAPTFSVGTQFDNYQSPSVGKNQGTVAIEHLNVVGFGDRLSAQYNLTEGLDKLLLDYSVPINSHNGTLQLKYEKGRSEIIQDPFDRLEISGDYQRVALEWRQPLIQNLETEFALLVTVDWQENESFLLGQPFSFIPEIADGAYHISALRFGQEWINRSPDVVLAVRSQFNLGLEGFNATLNERELDAMFFSWQGQFQWIQKLSETILFSTQFTVQLTDDNLLPLEQFQIGGIYSVRGYAYNFREGDNGVSGSVELRVTILSEDWGQFELVPFFDWGTVWNNGDIPIPKPNTLASIGLGLHGQIENFLFLRLDYGIPLVNVQDNFSAEQPLSFSLLTRWKF